MSVHETNTIPEPDDFPGLDDFYGWPTLAVHLLKVPRNKNLT